MALLAFLFVGFAPLSLRSALERRAAMMHGDDAEPVSWAAVQAEDLAAGPMRRGGGFDMEYRAL